MTTQDTYQSTAKVAGPRPTEFTAEQVVAQIEQIKSSGGILKMKAPAPEAIDVTQFTPEQIAEAIKAASAEAVDFAATDKIYFTVEGFDPLLLNGVATQAFIDAIKPKAIELYNLTRGIIYKSAVYSAEHHRLKPALAKELESDPKLRNMSQAEAVLRFDLKL